MQKTMIGVTAALLLAGCATQPPQERTSNPYYPSELNCATKVQPEEQVQLDMVDGLMSRGRNHAALAQLEARDLSTVDHWVRYGQLLAATGSLSNSETAFRGLVERCDTGRSHHGLGMVLLKRDEVTAARKHLQTAREMTPASAEIRNDYGYVLLMVGDYDKAVYELRTAMELGKGEGPVRQNLAIAYLLTDDRRGLQWMANEYDFDSDERAHAEKLADGFGR